MYIHLINLNYRSMDFIGKECITFNLYGQIYMVNTICIHDKNPFEQQFTIIIYYEVNRLPIMMKPFDNFNV